MLSISKKKSTKKPGSSNTASQLLLTVSLTVAAMAVAAEAEWILEKDAERVQIYTRPVPGSPLLEVKATTRINASIEKVAETFGDGNGCNGWQPMCKSSEVLNTVSETERYVYLVLDLPWPLTDRDMVIHSSGQIDRDARTVTVRLESDSSKHPLQEYLRAESHGQYQIKGLGDEQVEFTYIMHTDIGGDVSPDIINPRMAASMHSDVASLRALAEK